MTTPETPRGKLYRAIGETLPHRILSVLMEPIDGETRTWMDSLLDRLCEDAHKAFKAEISYEHDHFEAQRPWDIAKEDRRCGQCKRDGQPESVCQPEEKKLEDNNTYLQMIHQITDTLRKSRVEEKEWRTELLDFITEHVVARWSDGGNDAINKLRSRFCK